jgi:ABC-type multidrug transport system ATPase subunit
MITANANLTTIVISHRLSSIKKADRIAVIMDGKVKEIGMYEELMAKPMGHFRHLQQIQFGDDRGTMKARKKIEKKKTKKQSTDLDEKEEEIPINKEKEKANAKRARLMARQDLVYFVVGGIGALLAGAVFPAWGCKFHNTGDTFCPC